MLDKIRKEDLEEYMEFCERHIPDFNKEDMIEYTKKCLKYYNGNKTLKEELRGSQHLETRWYESLDEGKPDFSVYDDHFFLCEAWCCWKIYSRNYLRKMLMSGIVDDMKSSGINSIVDIGCGFGYTTCGLKELFPECKVYGTNLENTYQFRIATELKETHDFELTTDIHKIGHQVDMVFASEYFEHIENAIEHLEDIIKTLQPKYFIIANSFNAISVGHFRTFYYNGEGLDGKKTSRRFNKFLRDNGYVKQDFNVWNNRPTYWKKEE